jgi:hypothetical protein
MARPRIRIRLESMVAVAVAAATLVHLTYYLPRVVDDLFISLRYAENLIHGRGLVYNLGERVEGYSSPAWMFLQAIGLALGFEGVLFTKLLGIASLALLHLGLFRLSREVFGIRGSLALLPNVFLALDSHVIYWSVLGLETPGFLAALVWGIVLARRATEPGARIAPAAVALVVLAFMRPEAPAWVVVVLACEGKRAIRLAIPVAIACFVLLVARRMYFGHWVAHTYFVKGAHTHFDPKRVLPLFGHGATIREAVFVGGGLAASIAAAVLDRRRASVPLLCLAVLAFTADVEADWMPSLRHMLPVLVLSPIGWAWLADRLRHPAAAIAAFAFALATGAAVAKVEARNTLEPFGDGKWSKAKTREKWHDALLALRKIEPAHVKSMDDFHMGMITQNYRLLEAADRPLDQSWYVGRDIGKVGYYVDAKVFDIAGLFTPRGVESDAWSEERKVSDTLVKATLARDPIAIEVWDDWSPAFGRNWDLLQGYQLVLGDKRTPIDLVAKIDGPTPEEILRRYEASLAKFPRAFHLVTLFGEDVGAAMEKRTRIVRSIVSDLRTMPEPPPGSASSGDLLDDGALRTAGCALSAASVRPSGTIAMHCFLDVQTANRKPWHFFVHVLDEAGTVRFQADHEPVSGLSPSVRWKAGTRLHDVARLTIPSTLPPGRYAIVWGLYHGWQRATATGPNAREGDRVAGPTLVVVP